MHSKKILIADDDKDLVQILARRCRKLGIRVAVAYDALTALNRLKEFHPKLVVLDVEMPAGNGLSVCEMMTTDADWRFIPRIILTGRTDYATIRRCHELLSHYIPKRVNMWDDLEPLIVHLLSRDPGAAPPERNSICEEFTYGIVPVADDGH
ncbi:MAG: response regulator [Planctomycetaceae bacterium]